MNQQKEHDMKTMNEALKHLRTAHTTAANLAESAEAAGVDRGKVYALRNIAYHIARARMELKDPEMLIVRELGE